MRLLRSCQAGYGGLEQYLQHFQDHGERRKIALIKVGGAVLDDEWLPHLTESLAFLQRIGLFPVVLHGAGDAIRHAYTVQRDLWPFHVQHATWLWRRSARPAAGRFPARNAGPQLNKFLEEAGIEPRYHLGMRITDESTLGIVSEVFQRENLKLTNALEQVTPGPRAGHNIFTRRRLHDAMRCAARVTGDSAARRSL